LEISRLSFGTAGLHRLFSRAGRQALLRTALDGGITHFDTAPLYGFGLAEVELGRFIKNCSCRGRVTVTTKVGLYPPVRASSNILLLGVRKTLGKAKPSVSRSEVDWSLSRAQVSLDQSLVRLGVNTIDLLLLHEPVFGAFVEDEFLAWLNSEKEKGKIRNWGLAGKSGEMGDMLSPSHPLGEVLQVADSIDGREADCVINNGRDLQITFGYLASSKLASTHLSAPQVLQQALRRNRKGSVLVSTGSLDHLKALLSVWEGPDVD
jgi:D-threo-aldose 1-dehydrogenase